MKYLAIVQARMGSSRLPGKVLMELSGCPVIKIILDKVSMASRVDKVIVATTNDSADDVLVEYLKENCGHNEIYRGSENDVLDRFYQAAKKHKPQYIVRVTADDPLKDPLVIDKAIGYTENNSDIDYCSNTLEPTYPEGLDVEVFKFSALETAWHNANKPSEREHVTPYIWDNPDIFNVLNFKNDIDRSNLRWTLDNDCDLKFFLHIFEKFPNHMLHNTREIVDYLDANSKIVELNSGIIRNFGYYKSLEKESR